MAATKTAQQWLIDSMIAEVHKTGATPPFTASSPSPGIFRLQCFGTDIEYVRNGAHGTYFAAGDWQVWYSPSPNVWECKISHLTVPGDKIWFDFKAKVTAHFEVQAFIPSDAEVLKGGFNHATQTSTTPVGTASDRRLVVLEATEGHVDSGRLFALTPDKATGIPIPTFQVKPTLPASGTMVGESVFVTATRQGYVWDGLGWRDITASPILTYPTDAVLQTDTTHAVGTYAVASDTGNIYVYTLDGWRRIGIVEINDYNDLINWDAAIGTEAISRDLDVLFLRVENSAHLESWIPISQLVRPEADIISVQNVPGLTAVASDTGKRFVNNGTRWVQDPIEHYTTEAALLAATPIDGHMAWADDTQVLFTAANGTWHRLPGPQITVGAVQPTVNGSGDLWFRTDGLERGLKVWDGTAVPPAFYPAEMDVYPKVLFKSWMSGDASGELIAANLTVKKDHLYEVRGALRFTYDNESDRVSVSIRENNTPIVWNYSATRGGRYQSSCSVEWLRKAGGDGGVKWSLQLEAYDGGVTLQNYWLTVMDLGPA